MCCRSGRLYSCARCHCQVIICSHCDRGNIYCSGECSQAARCEKIKQANQRYEQTSKAKRLKSIRQQRYRQSQKAKKATDQGTLVVRLYDLLLSELKQLKKRLINYRLLYCRHLCCHFCATPCDDFLRQGYLIR